jgi:hypothetical protein
MPWLAYAAAAALAAAVAFWWYGRREEKVRGRGLAAVFRGAAVFFFLSAPWMPALDERGDSHPRVAILVDNSLSMDYPVGVAGRGTRIQSARAVVEDLIATVGSSSIWSFGRTATRIEPADLVSLEATGGDTRVVAAIEQARASGADSLIIVTDGELADREAGRRLSERLGIVVREVRVADSVRRVGIRSVIAPRMVTAGDTLEVRAEIVATGAAGDSATVTVVLGVGATTTTTVELPAAGRSTEAVFRLPAELASDSTEWQPLVVSVEEAAPGWEAAAWARTWVGVSPEPTGAVIVSADPDWEARYLSPVLERSVPGGVRVFLRAGDENWIQSGARPVGGVAESAVRRAAQRATLLVVQGDPGDLPPWLEAAARRRPAVMHFVRGQGPVPGTGVSIQELLPGEWYAETPPPAGPASAHLIGADARDLPPLSRLYGSTGRADANVLSGQRDRRGPASPIAVMGSADRRRWAVVLGEGTWRWAARGGEGLSLYRGLYAGMTRWLVERTSPQPVQLQDPFVRSGDSVRWRAAPGARDLTLRLEDASGNTVWSHGPLDSVTAITGPPLARGDARFVAAGTIGGTPFRIGQPFHVSARVEEMPNAVGLPLDVHRDETVGQGAAPGSDPPVWPFAVAILMLCAEWLWRRKVGLR